MHISGQGLEKNPNKVENCIGISKKKNSDAKVTISTGRKASEIATMWNSDAKVMISTGRKASEIETMWNSDAKDAK